MIDSGMESRRRRNITMIKLNRQSKTYSYAEMKSYQFNHLGFRDDRVFFTQELLMSIVPPDNEEVYSLFVSVF